MVYYSKLSRGDVCLTVCLSRSRLWIKFPAGYRKNDFVHTWHRQTTSTFVANISTTFPLPSSPHWAPKTTVTYKIQKKCCIFLDDTILIDSFFLCVQCCKTFCCSSRKLYRNLATRTKNESHKHKKKHAKNII